MGIFMKVPQLTLTMSSSRCLILKRCVSCLKDDGRLVNIWTEKEELFRGRLLNCVKTVRKIAIYRYKVMQTNWKIQHNYPPRKSWYGGQLPGHNDVSPRNYLIGGQLWTFLVHSPQKARFGGRIRMLTAVSPQKARNCGQTPWLVSCSPRIASFGGQTTNEANRILCTSKKDSAQCWVFCWYPEP